MNITEFKYRYDEDKEEAIVLYRQEFLHFSYLADAKI